MAAKKNRIRKIVLFGGVDQLNVTRCNASQCNLFSKTGCEHRCQLENTSRPLLQPVNTCLGLVSQILDRIIILAVQIVIIYCLVTQAMSLRDLPYSSVELIKTVLDNFKK